MTFTKKTTTNLRKEILSASIIDQTLSLNDKKIEDKDIPILCKFLIAHPQITSVDLSRNNIGSNGAEQLAAINTLRWLNLGHNRINDRGITALLSKNTRLFWLNLACNDFHFTGIENFSNNTHLRILNVSFNNLDDKAAILLAANKHLTSLNLEGNFVANAGAKELAKNSVLTSLNLSNNRIDHDGILAFKNTKLTHLDISGNISIENAPLNKIEKKNQCHSVKRELSKLINIIKKNIQGENQTTRFTRDEKGISDKIRLLTLLMEWLGKNVNEENFESNLSLFLALFYSICGIKRHRFSLFKMPHSVKELVDLLKKNETLPTVDTCIQFTKKELISLKDLESVTQLLSRKKIHTQDDFVSAESLVAL